MRRCSLVLLGSTLLAGCGRPAPPPVPPTGGGGAQTSTTVVEDAPEVTLTDAVPDTPTETSDETPPSDAPNATSGFETPEAAFSAIQQGLADRDWGAAIECLTPESQEAMAQGILLAGGLMAAFGGEDAQGIVAVFEKHGVEMEQPEFSFSIEPSDGEPEPPVEEPAEEMPEIEDQVGFIADMFTAMEAMGDGPTKSLAQWTGGELTDLTVDGDTATATLLYPGGGGSEAVEFQRSDAGWLVHIADNLLEMGPGEPMTDSVEPAGPLAESVLEDGLSSTIALTTEQPFEQQFFGKDFPEGTVYVTLTLVGDTILDTYEYGEFQLVAAEDDTGTTLELAGPVTDGFNAEFGEEFVELNDFFLEEKNTLPILFALTPASDGAKQLPTLNCSIKLKVRESIIVDDVLGSLDETIEVEDVGEFTIKKQNPDNGNPDHGLEIEFKGGEDAVESITLLDGDGVPLDTAGTFSFGFGGTKTFGISTEDKLPEGTQMRVTLGGSETVKVVPLTFEDLEL